MAPSWFFNIPVFAQLLPAVAAIWNRSRNPARFGIVIWALLLFITDALSWWQARILHQHNLWLNYWCTPISGAVLLATLSAWQVYPVSRLALKVLIPLYLLANVILVVTVENSDSFSLVTDTLNGLLLLTLVLYTLVTRGLEEREHLMRFDWFWVCSGLALYFSCAMAMGPISRLLIVDRPDLVIALIGVRAVSDTIAFIVIARGLLCPLPPLPSGGYSSPLSSASRSSS